MKGLSASLEKQGQRHCRICLYHIYYTASQRPSESTCSVREGRRPKRPMDRPPPPVRAGERWELFTKLSNWPVLPKRTRKIPSHVIVYN